jgi:hypothetical protein
MSNPILTITKQDYSLKIEVNDCYRPDGTKEFVFTRTFEGNPLTESKLYLTTDDMKSLHWVLEQMIGDSK